MCQMANGLYCKLFRCVGATARPCGCALLRPRDERGVRMIVLYGACYGVCSAHVALRPIQEY